MIEEAEGRVERSEAPGSVPGAVDERVKKVPLLTRLMRRPELGAATGLLAVVVFFLFQAEASMFTVSGFMNFMKPASQLGILAIGAALLMIGGEFDLSVGSMVAFAGLIFAACVLVVGLPFILALLVTLLFAGLVGFVNAQIVLKTGLQSFIVTLAGLFILRGLSLVGLKAFSNGSTQLRGIREAIEGSFVADFFFSGVALPSLFQWLGREGFIDTFQNGLPKAEGIPVSILWFIVLAIIATWILQKTRLGNWIFASGGDANAARNSGVPVSQVKMGLFIFTAFCASLYAILTTVDAGSTDALRGRQKEFEAIIAAVIGGCLLSGGYGSVIGAVLGAVIFGMVSIGLSYTPIDQDWYLVFLGGMLLMAVLFNNYVRKRATGE